MAGQRKYEKPVAKEFIRSNVIKYTLLGKSIKDIAENITELSLKDPKILIDYPEGIKCSQEIVMRYKGHIKKESGKWFKNLLLKRDDFISTIKERLDGIMLVKERAWDEIELNYHLKHRDKNGYFKTILRCEEDLIGLTDDLKYIADVYPDSLDKSPQRSRKPKTGSGEVQTSEQSTGHTEPAAIQTTKSTFNQTF